MLAATPAHTVYGTVRRRRLRKARHPVRVLDADGVVRLHAADATVASTTVGEAPELLAGLVRDSTSYGDGECGPPLRLLFGSRIADLSGVLEAGPLLALARSELRSPRGRRAGRRGPGGTHMNARVHRATALSGRAHQAPDPRARRSKSPTPPGRAHRAPVPAGSPLRTLSPARREELRAACARLAALDDTEFGVRLLANTPGHETRDETLLAEWARTAAEFGTELAADAPAGNGPAAPAGARRGDHRRRGPACPCPVPFPARAHR